MYLSLAMNAIVSEETRKVTATIHCTGKQIEGTNINGNVKNNNKSAMVIENTDINMFSSFIFFNAYKTRTVEFEIRPVIFTTKNKITAGFDHNSKAIPNENKPTE